MFKRLIKKLTREEAGFTLIELLVTIAILGVLFGIVTLTLTGVGSNATDTTAKAACGVVQSAADIWLAVDTTHTITARAVAGTITSASADAEFKGYLRNLPTEFTYTWTAAGDVSCPDVP
jgi:prepilin-type N-terminal cleavage/methylation domain-containing protein